MGHLALLASLSKFQKNQPFELLLLTFWIGLSNVASACFRLGLSLKFVLINK